MIDGRAVDFIDKLYYEDHYAIYNGDKYFLNGCQSIKADDEKITSVRLEVYNLSADKTIFTITKESAEECIKAFEEAPIWNGKTFWDIESQMQWVDE